MKFFESALKMPLATIPLRSTFIPLKNGKSVLISPILFDEEQLAWLRNNPPSDIVAPNCFHHLYVQKVHEFFPKASLHAAPELQKKRADIKWTSVLTPESWPYDGELAAIWIEGTSFNEIVFFHRDSKTLIVTDLLFNLQNVDGFMSRLLYRAMGTLNRPAVSLLMKILSRDRAKLKASIEKVLKFDFERIVVAHGTIIEKDGRSILEKAAKNRGLI